MNSVTDKERSQYLKQVRQAMEVSSAAGEQILSGLENAIEEYLRQNPDASLADIQQHFGNPEEVAAEYSPELPSEDRRRKLRRKKLAVGLLLALVLLVGVIILIYYGVVEKGPGVIKEAGTFGEPYLESLNTEHF